jgi:hypothetical protein
VSWLRFVLVGYTPTRCNLQTWTWAEIKSIFGHYVTWARGLQQQIFYPWDRVLVGVNSQELCRPDLGRVLMSWPKTWPALFLSTRMLYISKCKDMLFTVSWWILMMSHGRVWLEMRLRSIDILDTLNCFCSIARTAQKMFFALHFLSLPRKHPQNCSLATTVVLSPVYTAVTWQWVCIVKIWYLFFHGWH